MLHSQEAEKVRDESVMATARKLVASQEVLPQIVFRVHMIKLHNLQVYKVGTKKHPLREIEATQKSLQGQLPLEHSRKILHIFSCVVAEFDRA